ncbi:hypothetical protein I4U23_020259 [Adineta vaga]|nr:hypothetical protein I4U23_020259 [Adineta vaga]
MNNQTTANDSLSVNRIRIYIFKYRHSSQLQFYINSGNGSFKQPVKYSTPFNPDFLLVKDVDNDQKSDIIISSQTADQISIHMNTINGIFVGKINIPVTFHPICTASMNVNGDNQTDLIMANSNRNLREKIKLKRVIIPIVVTVIIIIAVTITLAVVLTRKKDTTDSATSSTTSKVLSTTVPSVSTDITPNTTKIIPTAVTSIVTTTTGYTKSSGTTRTTTATVGITTTTAAGTATTTAAAGTATTTSAAGIATTTTTTTALVIGTETTTATAGIATTATAVAATMSSTTGNAINTAETIITSSAPETTMAQVFKSYSYICTDLCLTPIFHKKYDSSDTFLRFMKIADIDGDNYDDIIISNVFGPTIKILTNDRNGQFVNETVYQGSVTAGEIIIGNVDNDRSVDIIAMNPSDLILANIYGDDKNELIVIYAEGNTTDVFSYDADDIFTNRYDSGPEVVHYETTYKEYSLDIADMNNDGRLDIIFVDNDNNSLGIGFNTGEETFIYRSAPLIFPSTNQTFAINYARAFDINNDHRMEIILHSETEILAYSITC